MRRLFNHLQADNLCELLKSLEQAGIPAIPFKGPVLAVTIYDDIALREFHDVDFLIGEKDISGTLSVLDGLAYERTTGLSAAQEAAYQRYGGQEICFGGELPIEPHWAFAPRTYAVDLDYSSLWSRIRPIPFNGRTVSGFADEDLLCLHGTKEKWHKLKWVADVAYFVPTHSELDWSVVHERASQMGTLRMVQLGLSLCQSMLGTALRHVYPDPSWLAGNKACARLNFDVERHFYQGDYTGKSIYQLSVFHWWTRERQSDRVRYLFRTITTPRIAHFNSIDLRDSMFFAYYPFKILHDYLLLSLWITWKSLLGQLEEISTIVSRVNLKTWPPE